jgi:periplasmic protein TonB
MGDKRSRSRLASRLIAAVGAICLILGFVWFVHVMMGAKSGKPQRMVQTIQVIRPPPPPPPDQPPPEKTQEPLPKDQPEPTPDQSPPPDQPLGLDAQGGAGSDAFGLAGRPGGGDLIGGSGTAPFAWYTNRISDAIKDKLAAAPCTKAAKGSLTVHVTMEADGRVKQIKLATTTGNPKVDECIDSALTSVTSIGDPVPPGMPAQVNLKIVART